MEDSVRFLLNKNGKVVVSKLLDWGMIYFLLLMEFIQVYDWIGSGAWSSNNIANPYFQYYQNYGIKIICLTAFILNCLLITQIYYHIKNISLKRTNALINTILFISTFLIWFELWYGSTFYYGEVRDKQGLPFGVNNFGIIGSILFLTYWISRINFRTENKNKIIINSIFVVTIIVLHILLINYLEGSWQLWQS